MEDGFVDLTCVWHKKKKKKKDGNNKLLIYLLLKVNKLIMLKDWTCLSIVLLLPQLKVYGTMAVQNI